MPYTQAFELQCQHHEQILQGTGHPVVLLVEHDPVITVSRRATASKNLLASPDMLRQLGIDVQPTDRGGDVTYHGPGQLVAYPILRLTDLHMNIGAYMRFLEEVVIQTVAHYGITARRDKANTGVWVDGQAMNLSPAMTLPPTQPAKLCAMGIRVRRNITLHGLALNITTNLTHFQTIIPCGLAGYGVTSLQQLLGPKTPSMAQVKQQFTEIFLRCLDRSLHSINNQKGL
ncbi:MAG: lipoyl(octanoyl) transferase LipB [Phycisphaerales bacterium]|nr:lipoyl(octanoyl) transferase LipB [Phycisphaerales bacterium]